MKLESFWPVGASRLVLLLVNLSSVLCARMGVTLISSMPPRQSSHRIQAHKRWAQRYTVITYSLCCYAGIVPKTLQSGGPDSPPVQGHVSPRCNPILKDWILLSSRPPGSCC